MSKLWSLSKVSFQILAEYDLHMNQYNPLFRLESAFILILMDIKNQDLKAESENEWRDNISQLASSSSSLQLATLWHLLLTLSLSHTSHDVIRINDYIRGYFMTEYDDALSQSWHIRVILIQDPIIMIRMKSRHHSIMCHSMIHILLSLLEDHVSNRLQHGGNISLF